MALHDDTSIERVALALIDRSLPKHEWTHEAHFAAALWMLRHRPDLTSPDAFRGLIVPYNAATGTINSDTSGYHHTITTASLRAAASRLHAHPADAPLGSVLAALMAGDLGRRDWLLSYWRRETLFSVPARKSWLEPDLAPLPF